MSVLLKVNNLHSFSSLASKSVHFSCALCSFGCDRDRDDISAHIGSHQVASIDEYFVKHVRKTWLDTEAFNEDFGELDNWFEGIVDHAEV